MPHPSEQAPASTFTTTWSKKIATRIGLAMLIVSLIPLTFAGLVTYTYTEDVLTKAVTKDIENHSLALASELELALKDYESTVLFLSNTPPIHGIIRAQENGGIDPEDQSSVNQLQDRLATTFMEMARADHSLAQIRYLDAT